MTVKLWARRVWTLELSLVSRAYPFSVVPSCLLIAFRYNILELAFIEVSTRAYLPLDTLLTHSHLLHQIIFHTGPLL